ncbi:tyrosine--tRNA ligase [Candidatus Woesearchaeota archaeon]|nr:tyrosine--tRNA ligase [Candidatus Woesearchaeota archaeon]
MDIEERFNLIRQVGQEIVTEEELKELLSKKKNPVAYDGFEPSGTSIHIAQGLLRAINVNRMTKAGCTFKFLVADWHAWANNKLEGNLENIQKVGKYLIEVWKACDMDLKNVEFVWASELLNNRDYWKTVIQIARANTVKRIVRCAEIMGRSESDSLSASQIIYPCMQAADIFHLKADICQLGMDQRKVNILAREIGEKLGYWKPVIVSHHMLRGLGEPVSPTKYTSKKMEFVTVHKDKHETVMELKMSKSKPDSAIFMSDSEDEVNRKISKAYCPEGITEENPILEYNRHIIFEKFKTIKIERSAKFGGDIEFSDYESLERAFSKKQLHPMDLKKSTSFYLNQLIEPVRNKLEKSPAAKKLREEISKFKVTR